MAARVLWEDLVPVRVWVPRCGCSLMAKSQISNLIMRVRFPSPAHTLKHMSKKLKKRIKKFFLPGTALIASLYISALFTIGIVIGYFGIFLFNRNFIKTGRVNPLIIDMGKWEVHFHHWILGSLAFSAIIALQSSLFLFWLGTSGAIVFHDIYTDKKWYKVIYRK